MWPCSNACFTLADPTPRLCPDAVGSANVNRFPTRNRLSGPHQETIGRSNSGNVYIRVGWYGEGVLFITTPCERQLHCTHCSSRSADSLASVSPDSRRRVGKPSRQRWGTIGMSARLMCSGNKCEQQYDLAFPTPNFTKPSCRVVSHATTVMSRA